MKKFMKIIQLTNNNIDDIFLIEKKCFSHPISILNLKEDLNNGKYVFIGCEINQIIIGYCGVFITSKEAYINNIAVLQEFRKKGVASKILSEIINIAKEKCCEFITLEVRESNTSAINLYKKLGFKQMGMRKKYYREPVETAIIMTKYFGDNL